MKVNTSTIREIVAPFTTEEINRAEVNNNPPFRSELFSSGQMDHHAQYLALNHTIDYRQSPELLLRELSENERILTHVNGLLKTSVGEKKSISPAAEWLLDNFYLIEEQINTAKRHLSKGYSKGLPRLKNGALAGYPRVYDIAVEIISHSDGLVDLGSLNNFISAYQSQSDLTLGELWAIPIMLRLALLENLGRVAARIAIDQSDSALANMWAKKIITTSQSNPKDLVLVIADMARSNPPMVSAFVAEFSRKLQWKGPELALPLHWIEQQLPAAADNVNAMVLVENQRQATEQVSVSNNISSLRFLAKMDWREFVEAMSVVEQTLREDIHTTYSQMDFHTRDIYRHAVEKIAKACSLSEKEIAQKAIAFARQSYEQHPEDSRRAHVGYYLIDKGAHQLEKASQVKWTLGQLVRKTIDASSPSAYFITIFVLTVLSVVLLAKLDADVYDAVAWKVILYVLLLIAVSQMAINLTNWISTMWIKPRPLPKLDFRKGIPKHLHTLVVVPTLLVDTAQADKLVDELEVRFLANRDPNLSFALLTDFRDAASETMPGDNELLIRTEKRIVELNRQHGAETNNLFFLFHRPRKWNPEEKIWMGYERKRGKLLDLNKILSGGSKENFSRIVGDEKSYQSIKYVITLDTDTQLPREAAAKLVGIMAHPLNQPVYSEDKKRIVDGYTIIQPRIAINLQGAERSGYTQLHENDVGIDPYTRVTSDVYQDVFAEGSFIGKGIYEVETFEKVLNNRLPENRILSHDLLEGSYARAGFASDVQFYEDYPSRYSMDVSRRHRWIRGDWQIASWIMPFVPGATKGFVKNPVSGLSRWKIFDNLRRSMIPIVLMILLLIEWILFPNHFFLTIAILFIIFFPIVLTSLWNATRKPKEVAHTQHINQTVGAVRKSILQVFYSLLCLPYEAYMNADAIIRTFWRIYVSRHKLMEWNPSGFLKNENGSLLRYYRTMWISPVLSLAVAGYMMYISSSALPLVTPLLILWVLSPFVVYEIDKPLSSTKTKLHEHQKIYLRELARKTWSFFEKMVTEDDHWLPPDNLQLYPIPVTAHRTSPTNIGMALLANLTAYDFGYSTAPQLIERTEKTFATLKKMERYAGHFYNWYDTQSLNVLSPRYVSTVDSGNMVGHLLTLRQGLLSLPNEKIIDGKILKGLEDTLRMIIHEIPETEEKLKSELEAFHDTIHLENFQLPIILSHIHYLHDHYRRIVADIRQRDEYSGNYWMTTFDQQLDTLRATLALMAPWLAGGDIPKRYHDNKFLVEIPTWSELANLKANVNSEWQRISSDEKLITEEAWATALENALTNASEWAEGLIVKCHSLAADAYDFSDIQYDFLYDRSQHLMAIGYHVDDHIRDASFYDLLASEARLSIFVAIAQGKLPQDSWFALGRRLTSAGNTPVLLSWSGSMFEYLMPELVMPTYNGTLLDAMNKGVVKKQIEYGQLKNIPWGISESCYNLVDAHLTYQYKAFGVPTLGFKRGLGQENVIAPYATMLALMIDPQAACINLEKMKALGFEGRYGFYEAVDYTKVRLSRGQEHAAIKTFMAHHQAMSFLSIAYVLLDQPMQKRFTSDQQFQTALLLLQEQVPKSNGYYLSTAEPEVAAHTAQPNETRVIKTPDTEIPEVQLLSNGHYFVMVSNAGGGYSRWKEHAVTRWREDATRDPWGTFFYIKNEDTGLIWSSGFQPTLKKPEHYEAIFSQGKAEFRRRDDEIETYTTIIVSPEDDVEVRRMLLTNHSKNKKNLSLTSYTEIVLGSAAADDAHPAFSKLFVQTKVIAHQHAITCTRRARAKDEHPPWMFHLMKLNGVSPKNISYETDRSKFIGRGHDLSNPVAVVQDSPLSGSDGSVLDPIVSIQYNITLEPGDSVVVDMVTGISPTAENNQGLIDKYQDKHLRDRAFELAWTHSQVVLRQIGATESEAQLFGKMAGSIIYMNPALRASPEVLIKNSRNQTSLWRYSISGDLPIVLLQISDPENILVVKQLIKAQAYWHVKGLAVDLVILNEDPGGYRQVLQDNIQGLVAAGAGSFTMERQGRIFVRPIDQVSLEDILLLQAVARITISDKNGTIVDQVYKKPLLGKGMPNLTVSNIYPLIEQSEEPLLSTQFFNGLGGFSDDGREYVIRTEGEKRTPLPWINVIANPHFGTIVSECGASYTWFENAHEFRLTPWMNDPIMDGTGEAFYIRDEVSGRYWSPLGIATKQKPTCVAHHGFGYSLFESQYDGIESNTCVYVDQESPVKIITIRVTNTSGRHRKLSVTGYVEWILGELASKSSMHIVTELLANENAIIARNRYNSEFQNYVTFFQVNEPNYSFTSDRAEFIGRNCSLKNPKAMKRSGLSGKLGAGYEMCASLQVPIDLANGEGYEVTFKLGAGRSYAEVVETLTLFRSKEKITESLDQVKTFWKDTLDVVQVETPDPSVNVLTNGWLLYQVLSCRLWGRSGFYQSGGAFGFRDQLQDVLALLYAKPELTRQQILLCASHQFREGDVQHWWHPPVGRGVRTRCSDDYMWLPFVTSRYIAVTGDQALLNVKAPYLQGRPLNQNEESYYDLPVVDDRQESVYDHCKKSIKHAWRYGVHGLPLMGSGDWNDGMNLVGIHGKGESVWLAFFLYDMLNRFVPVAESQNDKTFADQCKQHAQKLKDNISKHGWDDEWYLRAFFDDGTPLGSKNNEECKIDSITQSWSVLSEGGEPERSLMAMKSVDKFLVRQEDGLIQLLDPPFDKAPLDPGYIKGYVPGVRENGGQYTHAAIWTAMAFAKLGDHDKTEALMEILNPIHNGRQNKVDTYQVEPYVMPADIYGVDPHTGRGGWTWYTGSGGWMYQFVLESVLGFTKCGDTLHINPCIPKSWKSFQIKYNYKQTVYHIKVNQSEDSNQSDDRNTDGSIQLVDDGKEHNVTINL